MTVLYRKYRPKTFAEVAGQEHVKAALANEAATGHVAHSYLFAGPRGVGKTSLARIFAKAINCGKRAKDGDPCGECEACTEIAEGRALDVIEIDAASHTGVDNVREQVIEHARFAPAKLAYKVFIIDEVHMLSTSAFNALLKTLEEPPEKVVFILATTELHKLPATVVSRCQRFDFRKIPMKEMEARIASLAEREGYRLDPAVTQVLTRASEGCLRDAESLLSQVFALGTKDVTPEVAALVLPMISVAEMESLVQDLLEMRVQEAIARWNAMMEAGLDPKRAFVDLADVCRRLVEASVRGDTTRCSVADAADLLMRVVELQGEMRWMEPAEMGFTLLALEWQGRKTRGDADRQPPAPPAAKSDESVQRASAPQPEAAAGPLAAAASAAPSAALETIKEKWPEILAASQKRNHGLPYMLGAAELLGCEGGILTVGFQYAMYRDRLNDRKHRDVFEAAIADVLGEKISVKTILVAQRTDGLVEPAPGIRVEPTAKNLPEGFADLVKEFGGTVA